MDLSASAVTDVFIDHIETTIELPERKQIKAFKVDIPCEESVVRPIELLQKQNANKNSIQESLPSTDTKHVTTILVQKVGVSSQEDLQQESCGGNIANTDLFIDRSETELEMPKLDTVHAVSLHLQDKENHIRDTPAISLVTDEKGDFTVFNFNDVVNNNSIEANGNAAKEVCSIMVNIAAEPLSPTTTTAFSKMFTKTVDTETADVSTLDERHVSEFQIPLLGGGDFWKPDHGANEIPVLGDSRKPDNEAEEMPMFGGDSRKPDNEAEDIPVFGGDSRKPDKEAEEIQILVSDQINTVHFSDTKSENKLPVTVENTQNFVIEATGYSQFPLSTADNQILRDEGIYYSHNSLPSGGSQILGNEGIDHSQAPLSNEDSQILSVETTGESEKSLSCEGNRIYGHVTKDVSQIPESCDNGKIFDNELEEYSSDLLVGENTNKLKGDFTISETSSAVQTLEPDVSEYCPGLAIRAQTLEDIRTKRFSPEHSFDSTNDSSCLPPENSLLSYSQSSSVAVATSVATLTHSSTGNFTEDRTRVSVSALSSENIHTTGGQILMQCTGNLSRPAGSASNPIEVERKFNISDDTEQKLQAMGAKLMKEKTFTDVYFDTDNYALVLSDCWLRCRDSIWEAKLPVKGANSHTHSSTQYREVTDEKEISFWLVDHLKLDTWLRGDPLELIVQAAGLAEFARFTTTRRSYTLALCTVDLDLTDHGFRVGEIEVMAVSANHVPAALKTINSVAAQLGLKGDAKIPGKMDYFLAAFNPHLYSKLVQANIFTSGPTHLPNYTFSGT